MYRKTKMQRDKCTERFWVELNGQTLGPARAYYQGLGQGERL